MPMRIIFGLLLFLCLCGASQAQDALVVQNCGSVPQAYAVGSTRLPTVDVEGKLCLSGISNVSTFAPTCAASTAWFARLHAVDNAHLQAYDTFICGNVADGNGCATSWGSGGGFVLDALWILASDSVATATMSMCSPSNFPLTVANPPAFVPYNGYNGNGAAGATATYLNTNLRTGSTNSTYNSASSATLGFYDVSNRVSNTNFFEMGVVGASASDFCAGNNTLLSDMGLATAAGAATSVASASGQGLFVCTRSGTTVSIYKNGNTTPIATATSAAGTAPIVPIYLLALNNGPASQAPEAGTTDRVAAAFVGSLMTAAQMAQFSARLITLINSPGFNGN